MREPSRCYNHFKRESKEYAYLQIRNIKIIVKREANWHLSKWWSGDIECPLDRAHVSIVMTQFALLSVIYSLRSCKIASIESTFLNGEISAIDSVSFSTEGQFFSTQQWQRQYFWVLSNVISGVNTTTNRLSPVTPEKEHSMYHLFKRCWW